MCGICGVVSAKTESHLERSIIERMNGTITHRGPDGEGYFVDTQVMLGMSRLSIIDLETGEQPIANENETLWVVFNGEIYNFYDVRCDLEKKGHVFRTQSDTEVIVHAYEEYGENCVAHFIGMFSFALWDTAHQRLFIVRDRLGIKPLYYWEGQGLFVFASELKALLAHPAVPREIDWVSLDLFLSLEYIPTPLTIYKDINKLPPGYTLTIQNGASTLKQYWEISSMTLPDSVEACEEMLFSLMQDAVQKRLISDVPLGAFLSGGIDSSTVVALMSRTMTDRVKTFSIGFEDDTYNELAFARETAKLFNTDHHEELLDSGLYDSVESLVQQFDEPFGDFSIFPTFLVSKMARKSVKVVLTGDGGDEVFGGYETYLAQSLERYYRLLPAPVRQNLLPGWMNSIPPQQAKKGLINKTKRFVEGGALPPTLQHVRWMMFVNSADKEALYKPWLHEKLTSCDLTSLFEGHFQKAGSFDGLGQQQFVDIKTYLVDDILTKVDRMSMAASLEARVPLLDHRIVEFAVNLPAKMKLHRGNTKIILRNTMKDILPKSVLNKPKQGFSIPIKHWLRTSLRSLMMDLLSPDCVQRRGYFEPNTVTGWVSDHLDNRANHSHRLWALMVLELWQRNIPRAGANR